MSAPQARSDGRHERSVRTRAAILAAHHRLIVAGESSPTTTRIAAEAGVSPRTFFAHFPDVEALFAATADDVSAGVLARRRRPVLSLPLAERVDAYLEARDDIYGYLTPYSLAVRPREQTSPALLERRSALAQLSQRDVADAFAPELLGLPVDERDDMVALLETVTTWSAWYHLREELGLGAEAARRITRRALLQLLDAPR